MESPKLFSVSLCQFESLLLKQNGFIVYSAFSGYTCLSVSKELMGDFLQDLLISGHSIQLLFYRKRTVVFAGHQFQWSEMMQVEPSVGRKR